MRHDSQIWNKCPTCTTSAVDLSRIEPGPAIFSGLPQGMGKEVVMKTFTPPSVACAVLAAMFGSLGTVPALAQASHTVIVVGVGDAETGQFLSGVQVSLRSVANSATTDSMGQARLYGVRPGTYTVEARRLGYQILTAPVMVGGTDSIEVVMLMRQAAQHLEAVKVSAPYNMREFEARRAKGVGQFITQTQIDSVPGASLDALLQTHMRGVTVTGDAGNGVHVMGARAYLDHALSGPPSPCWPMIFLDGVLLTQDTKGGADISIISTSELAGVEYYEPSEVPAQYKSVAAYSPAEASEIFNPDLLSPASRAGSSRTGGAAGTPGTQTAPPTNPSQSNPMTGRTAPGTMAGPLGISVTGATCGVMLFWTKRT